MPPTPPREFAPLFRVERARLLDVLRSLDAPDWRRPTPCPAWNVLGLAAHLVGDDVSVVAWQRDDHHGTPPPPGLTEPEFVRWLDRLQVEWVHAARRLSPRLVVDLLDWLGGQVAETMAGQDGSAPTARVSWASVEPVPVWLDHARELSERWIHRQQILQALDRPSDLRPDLAEPVLDGLRWAYPFRLDAHRPPAGATVEIAVTGPEVALRWDLVCDAAWRFRDEGDHPEEGSPEGDGPVVARLRMTTEQGWRLLSNNLDEAVHGRPDTSGDPAIVRALLRTRAVIGMPQ